MCEILLISFIFWYLQLMLNRRRIVTFLSNRYFLSIVPIERPPFKIKTSWDGIFRIAMYFSAFLFSISFHHLLPSCSQYTPIPAAAISNFCVSTHIKNNCFRNRFLKGEPISQFQRKYLNIPSLSLSEVGTSKFHAFVYPEHFSIPSFFAPCSQLPPVKQYSSNSHAVLFRSACYQSMRLPIPQIN